uniref:SHSP domain-containing protein n=1 Tax=Panagrolaimus superbus TaxID=310955 RepID=A0A914Z7D2_9BILA
MPIIRREKFRQFREYENEEQLPSDSDDNTFHQQQSIPYYQQPQQPQQQDYPNNHNHNNYNNYDNNQIITIEDNIPANFTKPLTLQFSNHLDRIDRNWRNDPFWRDLYPRWAEPIFKEGIDIKANIVNDRSRFAVDIDAYQFKPEELQVKTLDDTLLIEGRHEDVKDPDNFTKMYFIRKYQLPADVNPQEISSSIDGSGRLTVEAPKHNQAIEGRERMIPIEGSSKRAQSRSSSYSPRDRERNDSGRGSLHESGQQSRNDYYRNESRQSNRNESRQSNYNDRYTAAGNDRFGASSNDRLAPITTTLNNDRPYTPKLSSPVVNPANTNGYHRSEMNSKVQDQTGFRHESRREEYRSESRNGILSSQPPRSSSVAPPLLDTWRSDSRGGATGQQDRSRDYRSDSRNNDNYRVESPQSGFGTLNRRLNGINGGIGAGATSAADEQNRSESRAESVRSVRILRKTFE